MKKQQSDYQPKAALPVTAQAQGDRHTLVFVRDLPFPPARVWRALTETSELTAWSPFDAGRDLASPGPATLFMVGGPKPEPMPAEVRKAEAPHLLEYTWGEDLLRWELEPTPTGTRLTLRHTLTDRTFLPKVAAGWHICLDVAAAHIANTPIPRIVAEDAMNHGWQRLHDEYARKLGL